MPAINRRQAMVLRGGNNNGIPTAYGTDGEKIAGRTAVGLSKDGGTLFLLAIDGVEGADPQYGAIFYDVGEWLRLAGALTLPKVYGARAELLYPINQDQRGGDPLRQEGPHAHWIGADPATIVLSRRDQVDSPEPRPRDASLDSSRWRQLFPALEHLSWAEALAKVLPMNLV